MEVRNLIRSLRRDFDIAHRRYVLRRALGEFARNPAAHTGASDELLLEMVYGWHNENWSATTEYLAAAIEHALSGSGPILECGSGLTTLALGIVCKSSGSTLWSLEHDPEWTTKVKDHLTEYDISGVNLVTCNLKDYGDFTWYDAPVEDMPSFSLVICDGPPAGASGGRYGLVPVMRSKLCTGAIILLDDAIRPEEQEIAGRWARDLDTSYKLIESENPYIRLVVP